MSDSLLNDFKALYTTFDRIVFEHLWLLGVLLTTEIILFSNIAIKQIFCGYGCWNSSRK